MALQSAEAVARQTYIKSFVQIWLEVCKPIYPNINKSNRAIVGQILVCLCNELLADRLKSVPLSLDLI
jgi:hypothetical protein